MQFVDRALARRFESAEEMPQVHHAHADQKMRPHIGSAVEPIAGGHMIFAGLGSPIGRAVGMGFDAPVTEADFDQLENFYYSRQAPAQIDYCPLTDGSLLEIARKRGYRIAELNNVLARKLDPTETSPHGPLGFTIRPANPKKRLRSARSSAKASFPTAASLRASTTCWLPCSASPERSLSLPKPMAFWSPPAPASSSPSTKSLRSLGPARSSRIEAAACKPPSCGEDWNSQPEPDVSMPSSSLKAAPHRCATPSD